MQISSRIRLSFDNDPACEISWAEFAKDNAEDGDLPLIESALDRGEVHHGGGGAQPEFTVSLA